MLRTQPRCVQLGLCWKLREGWKLQRVIQTIFDGIESDILGGTEEDTENNKGCENEEPFSLERIERQCRQRVH